MKPLADLSDSRARHRDLMNARDKLLAVLEREQALRSTRYRLNLNEPEWVIAERKAMFETVNAIRAKHGFPDIDMMDILSVERSATGHSDYSSKFALYCAELCFVQKEESR
jgi:hypothetical protein